MTTSNYDRFYDSLDEPCDKTLDPKTPDEYLEFIKPGLQIKLNLVKHTKGENTISLLRVLRSIISEQVLADLLNQDTDDYIYQAVKDEALKRLR